MVGGVAAVGNVRTLPPERGGASQPLNLPFSGKPRYGWPVYSHGTPRNRLFFSGATRGIHVIRTPLVAPLKNNMRLGGVWVYRQATPSGVKKRGSLAV